MRNVTLTAQQYRLFVYPLVAKSVCEHAHEWECQIRLVEKLNDPALSVDLPLTVEEQQLEEQGGVAFPFRRLLEDHATFTLEEDELKLLKARLEKGKKMVPAAASPDYERMLEVALKDPPKVESATRE